MKTKVETITPEIAIDILENHNKNNRSVSESWVQALANDIRNNRWTLTHQGIAFDTTGNLIDGQHRLWAVVFAEKPIEVMVTRDIPVATKQGGIEICPSDNVDSTRVRTNGQRLQMAHGVKNGNQVSAAIKTIALIFAPGNATKRISMANSEYIRKLYGDSINAILDGMPPNKRVGYIVGPLAIYHLFAPENAIKFRDQIATLENMSEPARVYARWIETHRGRDVTECAVRAISLCIQAFHNGDTIRRIVDGPNGRIFLCNTVPENTKKIKDMLRPINKKMLIVATRKVGGQV